MSFSGTIEDGKGRGGRRAALAATAAALALASVPAAAGAQAPGLPAGYTFKAIDSGAPTGGSSFGWGAASADLTGDGEADLLVAQGQGDPTHVFAYDGVTGQLLVDIKDPEGDLGGDPVLGFVYVEAMPDIGSCPAGPVNPADAVNGGNICDQGTISGGDGIPEIIVGARATRVDADPLDGDEDTRNASDPAIGRGYVFDGASAAGGETVILKRIDMPVEDRRLTVSMGQGSTQFGRVMMVPQGLAPCAGPGSEVNNLGVGPCPGGLNDADPIFGRAVRLGDVNGGGEPDIVTTARQFRESIANTTELQILKVDATAGSYTLSFGGDTTGNIAFNATAATVDAALESLPSIGAGNVAVSGGVGGAGGDSPYTITFAGSLEGDDVDEIVAADVDLSGGADYVNVHTIRNGGSSAPSSAQCATATSGNCQAGRAWVYAGEDIAGSDPAEILENPIYSVRNPFGNTNQGGNEFGGNVFRIGDVNSALDGRPEFVIADRNVAYPLADPDVDTWPNVGAAYLIDGVDGDVLLTYVHPEPQARSTFSASFNAGRPAGDIGLTGLPDVVIPAPLQNNTFADDGTAYAFRGQNSPGGGGQGGWQFAQMDDPTPVTGGGFGGSTTGVGELAVGPGLAANEMMIGSWAPFDPVTPPIQEAVGDVHIVNVQTGVNLQTIRDPSGERGSGFGVAMTPMGDLNDDGFLDFGITAYLSNAAAPGGGRAYILYSDDTSPPSAPPTRAAELASGRCANERTGTPGDDVLTGTERGDTIFALAGDDRIDGLGDEDCLDGGAGRDRLDGGAGDDSILGGAGKDRLRGGGGGDRLFGQGGRDVLIGGGGRDFVAGGKGNDRIPVRGGGSDEVNCGKGRDVVVADASDKVAANCERVKT